MRHRVKGRNLSRTASHRRATLNALATALFLNKKIKTTTAKAKETKVFAEKLITKAKVDSVQSRREVARFIKDKEVVKELFNVIAPKIGDRPGGYTRVVKLGHRLGDASEMSIIELVDFNDVGNVVKEPKQKTEKVEKPVVAENKVVEEAQIVEETPVVEETSVVEEAKAEENNETSSEKEENIEK
jgi:large subunit ribosomal protein L17